MKKISWSDLYDLSLEKKSKENKVFILPTDTIYGLHSSVKDKKGIKKIELLKKREEGKSFIILISSVKDLKKFSIEINENQRNFLQKIWPGKYTVIFDYKNEDFKHISKDLNSLAFRIPQHKNLLKFIKNFGPIVSTSANVSGEKTITSKNMDLEKEIKISWNDEEMENIDFYLESKNHKESDSSTILKIIR